MSYGDSGDSGDTTVSSRHVAKVALSRNILLRSIPTKKTEQHLRCSVFCWFGIRYFVFVGLERLSDHR